MKLAVALTFGHDPASKICADENDSDAIVKIIKISLDVGMKYCKIKSFLILIIAYIFWLDIFSIYVNFFYQMLN